MKERINLLRNTEEYKHVEQVFSYVRIAMMGILVLLGIVVFFYTTLLTTQRVNLSKLKSEEDKLAKQIHSTEATERSLYTFTQKEKRLRDALKDDAQFTRYYGLILQTIKTKTNGDGYLAAFSIDKDKSTQFSVKFTTFEAMKSFLTYAESKDFSKNFQELTLTNLSITSDQTVQSFGLDFTGTFTIQS